MAANQNNVATGYVEQNEYHVSSYGYKQVVPSLNKGDIIMLEQYQECELSQYFEVDLVNVYKNGRPNPNHMYEVFGKFSSHMSDQVRLLMLQAIAANVQFYRNTSIVCLGM